MNSQVLSILNYINTRRLYSFLDQNNYLNMEQHLNFDSQPQKIQKDNYIYKNLHHQYILLHSNKVYLHNHQYQYYNLIQYNQLNMNKFLYLNYKYRDYYKNQDKYNLLFHYFISIHNMLHKFNIVFKNCKKIYNMHPMQLSYFLLRKDSRL